jgi:hypothetical protein
MQVTAQTARARQLVDDTVGAVVRGEQRLRDKYYTTTVNIDRLRYVVRVCGIIVWHGACWHSSGVCMCAERCNFPLWLDQLQAG